MKFKATTKTKTLLEWFQAIHAVAEECIIDTSETDVVAIRVVDAANALLVDMRIPDHAWEELEMEPGRFGLPVEVAIDMIKTFDPAADATISLDPDDASKITLSEGSAWYTLPVLMPDNLRKPPEFPSLNLPGTINIDAARLQTMVKRAGSVSDHIRIGLDPSQGCMFVKAEGDTNAFGDTASFDGDIVVLAEHRVEVSSLFSLDYTEGVAKCTADDVVVEIGRDLPILISFMLHGAVVRYVQAPRIDKD